MGGKLIVLEGIDGSGKTTIAKMLVERLVREGVDAIYTCEPFSKELTTILEKLGKNYGAVFEALILAADRFIHVKDVIIPSIREGKYVVCDRYFYSTIAYQGARGADISWIREMNSFAVKPDVAIYLDIDPRVGIKRIINQGRGKRKLTYLENIALLDKVREIYLRLVQSGELYLVNADQPLEAVFNEVYDIVRKKVHLT